MDYKDYDFYIDNIYFNDGTSVKLNRNDIVVFVGPNNAGKSQCLKDLQLYLMKRGKPVVIQSASYETNITDLKKYLDSIAEGNLLQNFYYYIINGQQFSVGEQYSYDLKKSETLSQFVKVFIADAKTENRLKICDPVDRKSIHDGRNNPIDYVTYDSERKEWLSTNFKKAFGSELLVDRLTNTKVLLRIGQDKLVGDASENEQTHQDKYMIYLDTLKQLWQQGDGYRSFTGILLYLMLDFYKIYLLDEPEAFLHPPQSKILGRILGQTLRDDQQAFVSTHSQDFIKGLFDVCPERIKLIRITRTDDTNHFAVLSNEQINLFWSDPILKYSNIINCLFYKSIVICEGDSDCKLYSIINDYLKEQSDSFSESLFVSVGGKSKVPSVVHSLSLLQIDTRIIVDLDILQDKNVFKNLVESKGILWDEIESNYKTLNGSIKSSDLEWKKIKKAGSSLLPGGEARIAYNAINANLREHDIYIVEVGELENFIKEVSPSIHGPEWVNKVLESYPNLQDKEYDEIKKFIDDMNLS